MRFFSVPIWISSSWSSGKMAASIAAGSISGSSPCMFTINSAVSAGGPSPHPAGTPVGTRGVVRARHTHRRAEAARGGGNAFIVGGDNYAGQVTGLGGAFEYMLQHRLGADSSERLAWETGRSVTRRDNAQNFTAHRRFYHGIAVLHSWKKERLGSCDRPAI